MMIYIIQYKSKTKMRNLLQFEQTKEKYSQRALHQVIQQLKLELVLKNQSISFLTEEKESSDEKILKLELFLNLKDEVIHRLEYKILQLTNQADHYKDRQGEFRQEIQALREEQCSHKETLYELHDKNEELKEFTKCYKMKAEEASQYKTRCSKLENQLKSLQEEIFNLTKECIELQEYHIKTIEKNEQLTIELNHYKALNENFQYLKGRLQRENSNQVRLIEDYNMKMSQKQTLSVSRCEAFYDQTLKMEKRFQELQKELMSELNEHKQYITSLKEYELVLLTRFNDVLYQLGRKDKQASRYREEVVTHGMYIYQLQENMKRYKAQVDMLEDKFIQQEERISQSFKKEQKIIKRAQEQKIQYQLQLRLSYEQRQKQLWQDLLKSFKAYMLNRMETILVNPKPEHTDQLYCSYKDFQGAKETTENLQNSDYYEVQFGTLNLEDSEESDVQVIAEDQQLFQVLESEQGLDRQRLVRSLLAMIEDYEYE